MSVPTDREAFHTSYFDGLRVISPQSPGLRVKRAVDNTWKFSIEIELAMMMATYSPTAVSEKDAVKDESSLVQ